VRRRAAVAAAVLLAVAAGIAFATRGHGASAAGSATTTWNDVAPVFAEKCAGCHQPGTVAPFSILSAQTAKRYAQPILAMTQKGAMPPWMPGSGSPAYLGQDHRILTAAERALIARWVRSGAKLGSGRSIRPATGGSTAPGTTITMTPPESYVPRATGGAMDDYHCFVLDPKVTQDVFVTSAVIEPQRREAVHHVILFEAAGANADEARRLDAASGGKGWTCFGGPGLTETRASTGNIASERLGSPQWISAWVPGHTTNDLPQGTGVLVHSGALIVMQVHYNLMHDMPGMKMPDRSKAVLKVVPAAGSQLTPLDTFLVPAPVELPCPAGVRSALCSRDAALRDEVHKYGNDAALIPYGLLFLCGKTLADYPQDVGAAHDIRTSCDRPVTRPIRIYGVAGHMHTRGVDIRVELNGKTLLHIPHWDFHWQDAYYLAQPVDASPGDTIRVTCRFDNSRGKQPVIGTKRLAPRYVVWGEGTTDEMCLGLLQVAGR
jgi:mono/diheme cytochrome c family protein